MRVLAVVAHPDDETLGCGGTLARLADEGNEVTALLALRRCDPRGVANWSALVECFERACALLGARAAVHDAPLDETLAETHPHELHDRVAPWVARADLVLTHWPGDVNQVHRGVARAVEIATRPFRRRVNVSLFEIPSSTDQTFGVAGAHAFLPNEFVLLGTDHVRRKCEAMALYSTEHAPGRTAADVERRLRVRGAEVGAEFAEAFAVARRFV
ncbi:LmbE family protein [Gemmatirosa kalamazoonensis]|uniref:LmbE family protein n=1 Tax=Gemmatirosa kalamazoonensis TaxID=861299 RepID=W0RI87_9BACT|nr:PIG-L family deacetylase [Gemmatirosa kalamazoonensis]AHG90496.1 LmbE family protein [Gemmatirosa kalamazoonensis]